MKDGARLVVGIILLGLAIYLSMQYRSGATAASAEDNNQSADASAKKQPEQATASTNPPARNASQIVESEIVKPDFGDPPPGLVSDELTKDSIQVIQPPPAIADDYQPMVPFQRAKPLRAEGPSLVPVQPKSKLNRRQDDHLVYTIQKGDTLQSISRQYYGTADYYLDIYAVNRGILAEPGSLPEGEIIKIPRRQ